MNGLEAAASLFGSDNANADPFASLGSNEPEQNTQAADTTVHHNTNEDLFSSVQGSDFLAGTYENKALVEESQANSYYDNWSSAVPVGGNVSGTGYDTQAWYGNSGQAQNDYNQDLNGATTSSNLYDDPYTPAAANASTASHPYDPYTPSTKVPEQSLYTPSQPAPTSSSYPSNTYNQSSSTMPSYAPYAAQTTNYGNPSYTSPYATSASSLASVPPPPAPKAPLNRPKVSNAYDPPFPVSNVSTRRSTPRTVPSLSSAFGAYASPSPPQHPPPPPANANAMTSPYGSSYTPPQPSNQPPSDFHDPRSQSMPPPAPGHRPPSTSGHPHGQSAYGGNSDYSPQPQSSAYSPPTRADSVQSVSAPSAYGSTNGYEPSPAQTYPPAAPKDTFTHPAHPGSQTTVSPPPLPAAAAANTNINHYGLNRTASPRTKSPLSRNGSPAVSYPAPPKRTSVQQTSTSTPPPHGGSRISSPVSVRSQRVQSPDARTASPAAVSSYSVVPYTPSSSHTDATYVHQDASNASSMQLEPEDPEGSPYIPSVGSASAQPTTAGVEAFSVADNTSTLSAGNENLYLPKTQTSGPSFTTQSITNGSDSFTPYEPAPVADDNPYVPKAAVGPPPPARSMSNGSIYSPRTSISNDAYDPYAPSRHPRRQQSENDYGSYTSRYDYPSHEPNAFPSSAPSDSLGPPQELLVKAPTHTPYAPSPSLLGTNDPLGRTSARVPVFSFGFGGRIVTCFHGADKLSTGFDVALASRNSTGIQIRILNKVVPESALDLSPSSFPGPLFSDPGSPTTGLVRPGASAQMKTKKTRVVKYLTDRAKEISQGLGYLHAGSLEKRQAEGKLVLVKLLKIMIEHDGKLLGTSQAETAVRSALVPELELSGNSADTDTFTTTTFATVGEDGTLKSQLQLGDASDPPITVASLRPSSLDKIQDFLLRGERRKAYHFALDQKLWAHAMVIASGIDREAWKEVVNEFLRTELGSKDITSRTATYGQVPNGTASLANGREPLRVAYSLFSGQGAAAVQELIPQNPMAAPQLVRLPLPPVSHTTPMTPNFATQIPVANIPVESLSKWAEMISMMISSTMSSETSSALTALGDQLCGNQWVEAGHVCYLLSSQTSPIGGVGNPSARVVLLGAPNPQTSTKFLRDTDAIIFSEILEFAMGLTPPVKGHEPFQGLAHLQAYRLVRALFLAEIGEISLANRYCEAITASMNRGSPYFTQVLSDQLKGLSNRIAGTSHSDKSGSWMGSKIGKPSLDSIGGWLEGRFTKLVTGDSEDNGGDANEMKSEGQGFVGPFSHYSAISSTTTSNDPSPQSSVVSLNMYAPSHSTYAPNRTGSSMSNRSLLSNGPQERAASAMDYAPRRKASPGPKIASASASTTTFAQSRSFGPSVYSPPGTARQDEMTPRLSSDINEEDEGQEVSWWGGDNGRTPTTATFVQLSGGHAPVASSDGFISLMDNNNFMVQPQASSSSSVRLSTADEEEEDLGFGNSKKPRSRSPDGEGAEDAKTPATKEPVVAAAAAASAPQRPDIKPAQAANAGSGSWLSRWWKRDSTPGPVKANLGEEKTFYYDAELKRWVNKGAGEPEAAKPAAPPPPPSRAPSRAQTASPGTSRPRPPSTGPPPARPASAADLSAPPPPKTIMRVKSNLVPTPEIPEVPGSAPSTPTGTRLAPPGPPPGRPRSQASKRNIRSRYVDVFQQDGAA